VGEPRTSLSRRQIWSGAYARAEQLVTPDELKGALTTAWALAREIHVQDAERNVFIDSYSKGILTRESTSDCRRPGTYALAIRPLPACLDELFARLVEGQLKADDRVDELLRPRGTHAAKAVR